MAIIKKQSISVDDMEKLEPLYSVSGNVNGTITIENSMEDPKKI